jgi:hypothetical protein
LYTCLFQIDLATVTGVFNTYYTTFVIIREIVGPFYNETIVTTILLLHQSLFFNLLACIVSLQVFQVLSIVYAPTLSEWNDKTIIKFHRMFVLIAGLGIGGLICQAGGAMCRPAPVKMYFLQENFEKAQDYKSSVLANLTLFAFATVIIVCQVVIETKRYFITKEETKAEEQAAAAFKQIQNANLRLGGQGLHQLEVQFLPILAWQEGENAAQSRITNNEIQSSSKITKALALKISRYVTLFGILPAVLTIIALSLENINSLRPHGIMVFIMAIYGIVIPLILILSNSKLRKFAQNPKIKNWFN